MYKSLPLALLATAAAAGGCRGADPVSRSIASAVTAGVGTRIVLAAHTGLAWDRVCILGPYTPDDEVERITAVRGAARHAYDIRVNEGIDVLMFLERDHVVASIAHPRRGADFGPDLLGRCYPRQEATFSVRVPRSESWGEIGPLSRRANKALQPTRKARG